MLSDTKNGILTLSDFIDIQNLATSIINMSPIGVAIIGSGLFAKEQHLPAVMKCDHLALKAIYSRSLKSAKEMLPLITKSDIHPDLYSEDSDEAGHTWKDLLARDDISAVIIALPINSQPTYIEAALTAGKHVLAEKPIAPDVARGKQLIGFYNKTKTTSSGGSSAVTFAVAENFRFTPALAYAASEARKLGKVTHFNVKVMNMVNVDNKYYKTRWRTKPDFQGGFILDGGVHHAAASRLFLNGESRPETVHAFTAQAQEHLPPLDTVNAIVRTAAGGTGIFQHSAGTLMSAFEWDIACERGSVKAVGEKVTVKPVDGSETVKEFQRTSGVTEEVAAWAEALVSGTPNPLQAPEEALADLEFLEKMFRSGEQNGAQQTYELQK